MQSANVSILMTSWQGKIPDENVLALQQALEKVPDDKMATLSAIPLKNPIVGLILGLCFCYFGVDRFYKGDIGLGIAKLIFGWWTFGIWWIVDYFLVWKGIKKDNFNKIMQNIHYIK